VSLLQALIRTDSAPALIHLYLAESYRKQNQCAEAIEQYKVAVEKNAPQVACAVGTALCLLHQQTPQAAVDLLEAQVQRGLDDFRIDFCLGTAYQQLGRPGRASVHFAQALNKHPGSSTIYRTLADCLTNLHQEERARWLLEQASLLDAGRGSPKKSSASLQFTAGSSQTASASTDGDFPFSLL
jgi:predicted Zn-dependent protease